MSGSSSRIKEKDFWFLSEYNTVLVLVQNQNHSLDLILISHKHKNLWMKTATSRFKVDACWSNGSSDISCTYGKSKCMFEVNLQSGTFFICQTAFSFPAIWGAENAVSPVKFTHMVWVCVTFSFCVSVKFYLLLICSRKQICCCVL